MKELVKEILKRFDFGEREKEVWEGTPERVERFFDEFFKVQKPNLKKFKIKRDGILKVKGIRFYAICQHHLLPFFGTVEIEIKPKGWVLGLSKYARVVEWVARKRPTLQEDIAYEVAKILKDELKPQWVRVKVKARHMCIEMRGVKKQTWNVYECKL